VLAAVTAQGLEIGLILSALGFGFRHGIDWDHIAAITDVTSSQETRRESLRLGTLYALGHASVVLALGMLAIAFGDRLPSSVDEAMTRVVGVTLIALGVYVFVSLARHGRDFRMRSRWMLVFAGARRGMRWVRGRFRPRGSALVPIAGGSDISPQGVDPELASSWHHGHHGRPGHHHHAVPERDDDLTRYGTRTAFGVGMIHGVGAETPTQVLIFLAAAGAGGAVTGAIVLVAFIVGLLISNSLITLTSSFGFMTASRNFTVYATVAVVTGIFSLVVGTIFLLGETSILPAFFGG
jgi:high-affinity nickel-transport protein